MVNYYCRIIVLDNSSVLWIKGAAFKFIYVLDFTLTRIRFFFFRVFHVRNIEADQMHYYPFKITKPNFSFEALWWLIVEPFKKNCKFWFSLILTFTHQCYTLNCTPKIVNFIFFSFQFGFGNKNHSWFCSFPFCCFTLCCVALKT